MEAFIAPILDIQGLTVAYQYGQGWADAIREIDLQILPGQTYGLVGESGSGKTTLTLAIMRYLADNASIRSGSIRFDGQDLFGLNQAELRQLWGAQISLVPQNPLSALNPSLRISAQVEEGLRQSYDLDRNTAYQQSLALLRRVRLQDVERVAGSYPHQLSGGMQQRVMIAMAMSSNPRLLILDEPTTNLDVTTQAAILNLLRDLIAETQVAVLYVTHNLGVIAQICDRVAVLYAGDLVEDGPIEQIFANPRHPYTRALLKSQPVLGFDKNDRPLQAIPGAIPSLSERPGGCVFAPRCALASDICLTRPAMNRIDVDHKTRCHHWQDVYGSMDETHPKPAMIERETSLSTDQTLIRDLVQSRPVLEIQDLHVHFPARRFGNDESGSQGVQWLKAVDDISLTIQGSTIVGLVGESGSGKTTIARAVMGLIEPSSGEIRLVQVVLPASLKKRNRELLRKLQMVFQNPEDALNPYLSVGESLSRPLKVMLGLSESEAQTRVQELLRLVQLPADYCYRMPERLSGGEKQRVAIARAFASHPDLLVADEPVSSLDVSIQASILNLLNKIKIDHGTAMLFISHDIAVVGYLADMIAVVYQGSLMEIGPAKQIFRPPQHPYTEVLLSAVPVPDPRVRQATAPSLPDVAEAAATSPGCPFVRRCPHKLGDICSSRNPPKQTHNGKIYFCHIPPPDLERLQTAFSPGEGQKLIPPAGSG